MTVPEAVVQQFQGPIVPAVIVLRPALAPGGLLSNRAAPRGKDPECRSNSMQVNYGLEI